MSAPTSPEGEPVGAPERLHPLFLLSGLTSSLRGLAGAYALLGYLLVSGRAAYALLGAVGLLVFGIIATFLYWTRFEFRIGSDDIRVDSGIINRTHRSIPFDRIQDVEITQGPLQRLLGLARVTFETGGGSATAGAEQGVLQAITLERANQIRALVRSRRSGVHDVEASRPAEDEEAAVYAMSLGRLLRAGAFNFSLAVLAGLLGVSQTFGDAFGFDPLSPRFWRGLLATSAPLQAFLVSHRAITAAAGVGVLVLIGLATGIVRTVLRDYGFRLDRTDVGLRRRRGLLTRTDVTLPVKRAQAVVVRTGPVRNLFGWRELKLQSLAREEDGKDDHVLAPLATDDEVATIVARLGWRPPHGDVGWIRVSRAYVWARLVALSPLLVIVVVQAAAAVLVARAWWDATTAGAGVDGVPVLVPTLVMLALIAAAVLSRWLDWAHTSYALDGDRLLIRSGWWRRRLVILPIANIQSIDLAESFVSRWLGVATLRFGVAGGGIGGHAIPAMPRAAARLLRDDLLGLAG